MYERIIYSHYIVGLSIINPFKTAGGNVRSVTLKTYDNLESDMF